MFAVLLLLLAGSAMGAEQVILQTGFTMNADRHEVHEGNLRLYANGGVIEIPMATVASIAQLEAGPAAAPATPAPTVAAAAVPAPPVDAKELVNQAADRWGLPREFLHSVARVESGYQVNAVSPKGAIGVMQLMPQTAARLEADPQDPAQNVDAGARYLRELLLLYQGQTRKALAAYNAGEKAVDRYGGVPPYPETQMYVEKVLRQYQRLTAKPVKP